MASTSASATSRAFVVHSGHPRPLQRFTAAHEYGHHVLGHSHSLDTQAEIEGQPTDAADPLAEIAAQAFAGALLMPLHLVNQVAANHQHRLRVAVTVAGVSTRCEVRGQLSGNADSAARLRPGHG